MAIEERNIGGATVRWDTELDGPVAEHPPFDTNPQPPARRRPAVTAPPVDASEPTIVQQQPEANIDPASETGS